MLLAYAAAFVIAILSATVVARWARDGGAERVVRVRILAGVVAAAYALVVVGVVSFPADGTSAQAWAIATSAVTGGVSYVAGLLRWTGSAAWLLRLAGWVLMVGAAAVPSHLTLLLPLVATLTVTLHRAPPAGASGSTMQQSRTASGTDTAAGEPGSG